MDKIEKIHQYVESLYDDEAPKHDQQCDFDDGYFVGIDTIAQFIDTLSEEPDKSLEEEIKNYFQGYFPGTETVEQCNTDLHFTPPAIIRLARHFAEWQKEQMLKDAVEGLVMRDIDLTGGFKDIVFDIPDDLEEGDKVRIIVLKEEEE